MGDTQKDKKVMILSQMKGKEEKGQIRAKPG